MENKPRRLLFMAEAVTLAHVGRPIALAESLPADRYAIHFACNPDYRALVTRPDWSFHPIDSISSARFLRALASGSPVYDTATLRDYVEADLALLSALRPDMVIGDFRLSLSISARKLGVPYATVTNAYWSPWYRRDGFPLPVLPMTKFLPVPIARSLFGLVNKPAFAYHTLPLNRVRRAHGLASLGTDLCRVYTDADATLYADHPSLFPMRELPSGHRFLGPVLWHPPCALPAWWHSLPEDRPILYVTLGSSGAKSALDTVLRAVNGLPVSMMVATAGTSMSVTPAANVHVADYLPGTQAAARAHLVICNGGSPTSQQGLVAGKPVLGIASNMDQFMNMQAIEGAGAGRLLRADRLRSDDIRAAIETLLHDVHARQSAQRIAAAFAEYPSGQRFADFVAQTVDGQAMTHEDQPH